jgi:serine/threonine-protein kinase
VSEVLDILDEVLSALGAAHGAGVVHRDLKPSNIFLVQQPDGSRYVKLLDFGLAKMGMPAGRTAQTRTDMVVGTPEYMAPEQARGQPVGPMTDLYALGVVAFEMVTGRLPFTGTSPVDLLMKHVDARPPRPSEFVPELPSALDAFILQMLTKDPEARPGTAESLRRQLQRLRETLLQPRAQARPAPVPEQSAPPEPLAETPQSPSTPPPPTTVPPERASEPVRPTGLGAQRRILVPVGLGALALVAAGGIVFALREPTPTPPPQVAVVTPQAPVQPRPQPQVQPPTPDPAQPPPNTAPVATADAGTPSPGLAVTPPETSPQETPPPETPQKARAPTQSALLTRVRKLERDVEARAEAGQPLSPATSRTLTGLRKKAETAGTPEERRQVANELSAWERLFLRRR